MAEQVKRAFKYRFYPTDVQAAELSRTLGCVRLVYNKALQERTRAWFGEQRRMSYVPSGRSTVSGPPGNGCTPGCGRRDCPQERTGGRPTSRSPPRTWTLVTCVPS
jgi:hypothetical protein